MKKFNTSNIGGHLISLDDFRHVQEGFNEGLDGLVRSLIPEGVTQCILSGCVLAVNGTAWTVTGGYIYYNGEIFEAVAGSGTTAGNDLNWVIDTSYAAFNPVRYETGEEYNVHEVRKMRLQQGVGLIASSDLQRLTQLFTQALDFDIIRNQIAEIGEIKIFRGNVGNLFEASGLGKTGTKYAGWALADGNNGTINLKGRFVVGFAPDDIDYDAIGKTGGAKQVTLTTNQIPSHTHSISTNKSNGSSATTAFGWGDGNGTASSQSTASAGGSQSHENRPPYYVVAYIEKIA